MSQRLGQALARTGLPVGPLSVGEPYELDREVVFLSGSRRTESMWVRTRVYRPGSDDILATMLLNSASMKDSYANYAVEALELYGNTTDPTAQG